MSFPLFAIELNSICIILARNIYADYKISTTAFSHSRCLFHLMHHINTYCIVVSTRMYFIKRVNIKTVQLYGFSVTISIDNVWEHFDRQKMENVVLK